MTKYPGIKTLFMDIGGVLLTNGWDHNSRQLAITQFNLDKEETEERHHLTFDTYEEGKLSLDEYLNRVVFYEKRDFSKDDFREFMFSQSQLLKEDSLGYFKELKRQYSFKVVAVSNEGRELNEHRIKNFGLSELFDAYISSCYVHMRKPDTDLFRMACDVSQTPPDHAVFIDDRLMFVQVARSFGLRGLHYKGLDSAKEYFSELEKQNILK